MHCKTIRKMLFFMNMPTEVWRWNFFSCSNSHHTSLIFLQWYFLLPLLPHKKHLKSLEEGLAFFFSSPKLLLTIIIFAIFVVTHWVQLYHYFCIIYNQVQRFNCRPKMCLTNSTCHAMKSRQQQMYKHTRPIHTKQTLYIEHDHLNAAWIHFVVYYAAQAEAKTREVLGFETL